MSASRAIGRAIDRTGEALMLLLLASAPVAFGSVHVLAYSTLEIGCILLFVLWVIKSAMLGEGFERRLLPLFWLWAGFMALGLFMLTPLPASWAAVLSPKAYELFKISIKGYGEMAHDVYRALSITPHQTLSAILKTAAYGAVFFVAAHELSDRGKARRVVLVIVLIGFCEALYGLYNFFHAETTLLGIKRPGYILAASGTYINRNHFAGFLGMALFAGAGLLISLLPTINPKTPSQKPGDMGSGGFIWLVAGALAVIAASIGFSLSRMAMAGGLATFMLMILALGMQGMRRHIALALLVMGLGTALLAGYGVEPIIQRMESLSTNRPAIWASTLALARDFPLLGSGLGTFREAFQLYTPEGFSTLTLQAHCDYLELITETGAIGGAMGIAAIGYFSVLAVRGQMRRMHWNPDHESRMLCLGANAAVCYILLFSITDFNLQIPANAAVFSALAGLSLASGPASRSAGSPVPMSGPTPISRLSACAAILVSLPALVLCINQFRAEAAFPVERAFFRASHELVPRDKDEADLAAGAARLVSMNPAYPAALGQYYMNEALSPGLATDAAREKLGSARALFRQAIALNPADIQTRGRLAWAEFSSGNYLAGMRELDTSLKIAPTNYLSHLSFAQSVTTYLGALPDALKTPLLYRARGEYSEAIRLNPSLSESPHVITGIADMHILYGERQKAIEVLAAYAVYTPEALPSHLRLARMYIEDSQWKAAAGKYRHLFLWNYRLDSISRGIIAKALLAHAREHPTVIPLQNILAEVSAAGGMHEARIEALERMLAAASTPVAKANMSVKLGEAFEAKGDKAKAREMYLNALSMYPSHKSAQERFMALMRQEFE